MQKIKKGSVWAKKGETAPAVRVSRLRKTEICFYPYTGGGAEQKLPRDQFLHFYELYAK